MRVGKLYTVLCLFLSTSLPAFAGVFVSSPATSTVTKAGSASTGSSVHFVATANSPACKGGVDSMGIYTSSGVLAYTVSGAKLDKSLSLGSGTHNVAVQEWDKCGQSSKAMVKVTVSGSSNPTPPSSSSAMTVTNLQSQKGWSGYALLPPSWGICSSCTSTGSQLKWSWTPKVSSPSMDSISTKSYYGGGSMQWGDVLWNNHLIGNFSSQGLPDTSHTLAPKFHTFTYDVYFWVSDASVSQAMEFDINQFVNGKKFIWGHECRIAGGHQWDIYNDTGKKWMATGVACNPVSGAWNHLTIVVQRTSDDQLLFKTITLNGKTATINHKEPPTTTSWRGITVNYQLDGARQMKPYNVYLDKFTFKME